MIYYFAVKIEAYLSKKNYISSDDVGIVAYGLFSIISKVLYGMISITIGKVLNCFIESICFYICFLFIKKYAGGYHAKTEFRCFLLSSLSIGTSILGIYFSKENFFFMFILLLTAIFSCFFIVMFAPVPSKERPLDKSEAKRYSKITMLRIFILVFASLSFYLFSYKNICVSICCSLALEGILLIVGKLKNYYNIKNSVK